jgi:hypothetical protein
MATACSSNIGLLFLDLHEKPRRLRVNGTATLSRDDPLLAHIVGAQLVVRVKARAIFPNCPPLYPEAPARRGLKVRPAARLQSTRAGAEKL